MAVANDATRELRIASRLAAPPETVWAAVSTWAGVNHELAPLLRMTRPRAATDLRAGHLGRSWLLLGGLVPVDYDDLHIESLTPGEGFRERSRLASAPVWRHDRTVLADGPGCRLVDEVGFRPRIASLAGLQAFLVEAVFRHRHRRLRLRFGLA